MDFFMFTENWVCVRWYLAVTVGEIGILYADYGETEAEYGEHIKDV